MHVLITCKNGDDSIKIKELEWSQQFSHYQSIALSLIWPNFELVRDFMVVLVTCKNKNEEDQALECSEH